MSTSRWFAFLGTQNEQPETQNQKPINRLLKKMIEKPEEEDEEERQPIHSN